LQDNDKHVTISIDEYNELKAAKVEKNRIARELKTLIKQNEINRLNFETQSGLANIIASEKLKQEMYVRLLLESCPDIMLVFDENIKFLLGTNSIADVIDVVDISLLHGCELDIIIERYRPEAFTPEIIALIKSVVASRGGDKQEKKFKTTNEKSKYEGNVLPFYKKAGEFAGVLVLLHDVTSIVTAKELAEQASLAKGDFLSRMSHEMRTPMNAIIGMTSIAKKSDDSKKIEYCLDKIEWASKHLLSVINDILDMSKIEANKLEISCSAFNFKKMISSLANVISFRIAEKHQRLIINIEKNVPDIIVSDEFRLTQIITNLLSNAVKFTPDGGTITIAATKKEPVQAEPYIQIEVADTGIGISPEQQSRLFTSFEQAEGGIARKYGGTGLGLSISKRIVELLGGNIWIESELGKGSRFIFTLKYEDCSEMLVVNEEDHMEIDDCITSDSSSRAYLRDYSNHIILIAEDISINREIVAAILEETGIKIDFAENGKETISMYKENPGRYSLVLMDIQMPEMDGYEATRCIRSSGYDDAKTIPIIAMTANVFKEDIEKSLKVGMNDHLGKPIDIKDLFKKLDYYLSRAPVKAK